MTGIDIAYIALLPSLLVLLIGLCIADHSRRWENMSDEEKAEDFQQQIW